MANPIERFEFDPPEGWNNPTVFPTFEADETQVRADLQELHDQTRDFLNNQLLQSVDAAVEGMEEYVREAIAGIVVGTLPDGSVTAPKLALPDESPEQGIILKDDSKPGGFAVKQASELLTNYYTKEETLTEETAAAYGLDANATPEGVFDFLSFLPTYTEYWWKRYRLIPAKTPIAGSTQKIGSENARNFQYSSSASIVNGEIVLDDPQSITVSLTMPTAASQLAALAPCYLKNASSAYTKYVYLPAGSTGGSTSDKTVAGAASGIELYKSGVPAASIIAIGVSEEFDFVHSPNRNAYPDADDDGNYFYEFQGKPFENLPKLTKNVRGSYTGTGECGSEHPNSLNFPFVPKLVIILGGGYTSFFLGECGEGVGWTNREGVANLQHAASWNGVNLSWYIDTAWSAGGSWIENSSHQQNASGVTYQYIAIG